ncbi:outer membrane beta-barrel protein [Zeaxanthinibacter enoshimensis]|uniref:Outer membrane protein with beta-barrel domain n=1 Tax=Zeaxanthinibacter enoshimensis TaxID=392009 RepID=A0A4R6TS15_9FLAO|nr:outer membrane beta-barrel protein [Zeaxanthinibacter enoshimensis]TDQ33366.1 outer membrane protein with beta-barrel domain [Zeaxanthinibacter enoshimensis]
MSKNNLLACILLCMVGCLSAQSDFREGYVISLEKDTIHGLLAYRTIEKRYESCVLRTGETLKTYTPAEILGYGFINDEHYSALIVEGTFVEVLVEGQMSLYQAEDKFVVKKDGELIHLDSNHQMIYDRQKYEYYTVEKGRWRGKLSYMLNDCLKNSQKLTVNIRLRESDLTPLVVQYNQCKGEYFKEYKTEKPWSVFEFGAIVGVSRSQLVTSHDPKFIADDSYLEYMDDSYENMVPTVGILVSFTAPRISERFAFQMETHFSKSSYQSLVIEEGRNSTSYHDTFIALTTVGVPLSLKYTFPGRSVQFFLQGGGRLNFNIDSESYVMSEEIEGNEVQTSPVTEALYINKSQVGAWGGVGVIKSFKHFKSGLTLRYTQMSRISHVFSTMVTTNQLSLNFIVQI